MPGSGYPGGFYPGAYTWTYGLSWPISLLPSVATGRLSAEIWSAGGVTRYGTAPLQTVIAAQRTRRINAIGDWSLTIPATDPNVAQLVQGREVHVFREGEGEIWQGIIEASERRLVATGQLPLDVSGRTLAAELVYANSYFGQQLYNAATPATIFASALALANNTWTSLLAGGLTAITSRFDLQTVWQELLNVATIEAGYLRETNITREIELAIAHADSGIRLINAEYIDPAFGVDDKTALIVGLPQVKEDGASIVNRLVPFGSSSTKPFNIGHSSRTTPYTIKHVGSAPTWAGSEDGILTGSLANNTPASGISRSNVPGVADPTCVCIAILSGLSLVDAQCVVTYNGIDMTEIAQLATGEGIFVGYGFIAYMIDGPSAAMQATGNTISVSVLQNSGSTVWWALDLLYIPNADINGIQLTYSDDTVFLGNSKTWANVAVYSPEMQLGIVAFGGANATITPDAGWTTHVISASQLIQYVVGRTYATKTGVTSLTRTDTWNANVLPIYAVLTIPSISGNYYLEDSAAGRADSASGSVEAYGRRVQPLVVNELKPAYFASDVAAANALYDYAATMLARMSVLPIYYQVGVVKLPRAGWLPGDTMRLQYRGVATDDYGTRVWLDVDDDIIVSEAQESYNTDGTLRWTLTLATVLRYSSAENRALGNLLGQMQRYINALNAQL